MDNLINLLDINRAHSWFFMPSVKNYTLLFITKGTLLFSKCDINDNKQYILNPYEWNVIWKCSCGEWMIFLC